MDTNEDKLTAILVKWLRPNKGLARMVLERRTQALDDWAKGVFALPNDYTILDDWAFLADSCFDIIVTPVIRDMLTATGITDDRLIDYATRITDALIAECRTRAGVLLFGELAVTENDALRLKAMLGAELL